MPDQILLDIINEHLPYEIDMLRLTYCRLSVVSRVDPASETNEQKTVRFALIESFCVHSRALLDFFSNRSGDKTDAIASDFTTGYVPTFDPTVEPLKTIRTKVNKYAFHLTKDRTILMADKFDAGNDGMKILLEIEKAVETFAHHLIPAFRHFRCKTEPVRFVTVHQEFQSSSDYSFSTTLNIS